MENEMRKDIDKIKNIGKVINENDNFNIIGISPSPFGGTKSAEYKRSIYE